MSESPLQIDTTLTPESGSAAVFPDLPWRVDDVVIGFLPAIVVRAAAMFIDDSLVLQYGWVPTVLFFVWVWFYPAVVAWRRGARFQRPAALSCLTEAAVAVPTLFAIWIGLGLIAGIVMSLSGGVQPLQPHNPFVEPAANPSPVLWALMLSAVAAAPIGEELFFRGMLYCTLKRYVDIRSAILLQGIIFGFAHSFGILHAIMASFLGIAFALVYEWRKTIVAPMCVHVLQNAAAVTGALVLGAMIANGPFLGVLGQKHARGCEIIQVQPDCSADAAGIRVGDIVIDIDGTPIVDFDGLKAAIRAHKVGEIVKVQFYRGDELTKVDIELKKRPKPVND